MDQDTGRAGQAVDEQAEPEEIRREIDDTREGLGDTVEALAAKSDVKGQAKAKVEQAQGAVRENPLPAAVGAGVVAGFLLGRLTGRR
jgi:ElaB/YqjD/DUF883 family membrane-anchored ribosome-binding protein